MKKKVIIVGGGLAGLSAAIHCAVKGFQVQLFEKNTNLGGKMSEIRMNGYRFDAGPSLLTMPFVIDELFSTAGVRREDYVEISPIDPICRYFYPDGSRLDASANAEKMLAELARFAPEEESNYRRFLEYSREIYDLTADIFLHTPIHETRKLLKFRNLRTLFNLKKIDSFRTMHQSVSETFSDKRLIQLFDRYATYNGSNPFQAPATLNIIPYVELGLGGYYIRGGMFKLVNALKNLARQLGVAMYMPAQADKILHDGRRVRGIQVQGEEFVADYVICNADVVVAHNLLIDGFAERQQQLNALEPSISGMVFCWGVEKEYPQLAHHNIVFSEDYEREFTQIFTEKTAPDDPTIYISITSKTDAGHAPANAENWFVLLNMPYFAGQDWTAETARMKETVIRKLYYALGIDIAPFIACEHVLTPLDFSMRYGSNRGSIYGISSNSRTTAFQRPANRSRELKGLYFAGGSTHPGGGIPLVLLSGKMAAQLIEED